MILRIALVLVLGCSLGLAVAIGTGALHEARAPSCFSPLDTTTIEKGDRL